MVAIAGRAVPTIELEGRRYVVIAESDYLALLDAAGGPPKPDAGGWAAWDKDATKLGARLAERRHEARLSQVALATRAGIRVETLNRIERGHVTPDYATVRRLVLALREVTAGAARRLGGSARRRSR